MDNLGIPLDSEVIHMDSEVIRATCDLRDASASKKKTNIHTQSPLFPDKSFHPAGRFSSPVKPRSTSRHPRPRSYTGLDVDNYFE